MEVDMSNFNVNSLSRVTVENILDGIKDEYSVVYSRDGARLLKCDNIHITNYKIKDNTVVICDMAFKQCKSLNSIIIPESITTIGNGVFSECESLASIIIPNSVVSIGNNAFSYCVNMNFISLSNNVTFIGIGAFNHCVSLKSIRIPSSLSIISRGLFHGCNPLKITISSDCFNRFKNVFDSLSKDGYEIELI